MNVLVLALFQHSNTVSRFEVVSQCLPEYYKSEITRKFVDPGFLYRNARSATDTGDASAGSQEVYGCVRRSYSSDSGPPVCGRGEEQRCMLRVWWRSVILPGLIRPAQIFSGTCYFMMGKRLTCRLRLLTQDRATNVGFSLLVFLFCSGTSLAIS